MKRFIKNLLLWLFPLLLMTIFILSTYLYYDPYKVIHHYSSFFKPLEKMNITLNKDYVSTETFIDKYPIYNYDSYIFGNSRSQHYHISDWSTFINSNKCFHFDASGENIYGIATKIAYLHKKNILIKNALIVIDSSSLLSTGNPDGYLYVKDPAISGESKIKFNSEFLSAFLDKNFLFAFYDFKISGGIKKYMVEDGIFTDFLMGYDSVTNEISFPAIEDEIKNNPEKFYSSRMHLFEMQNRPDVQYVSKQIIGPGQEKLLTIIKDVLIKDHTNYRIIINPHYDQRKLNPLDLAYLQKTFGKENVFDFSGKNVFTQDYHNYYDGSHYRPFIAKQIMELIYK